MINLLPSDARKRAKLEYWLRTFSVWQFLAGVAIALSGVFFIPSYILLQSHIETVTHQTSGLENAATEAKEARALVKKTNVLANELAKDVPVRTFSEIVTAVQSVQVSGISPESYIAVRNDGGDILSFDVQGRADTRENLIAFKDAVEAHHLFNKADVPIEDFVRGTDLPFTMTIMLSPEDHG